MASVMVEGEFSQNMIILTLRLDGLVNNILVMDSQEGYILWKYAR